MASGRKNYFRHSFQAHNDIKLKKLHDAVGVGFYFYYFSLLELCGSESSEELKHVYEFHISTFRSLWGRSSNKCDDLLSQMAIVELISYEKDEKVVRICIPNLKKYLGKYTIKNAPNCSNKKKRKEIKEKEKKEKEMKTNELSRLGAGKEMEF